MPAWWPWRGAKDRHEPDELIRAELFSIDRLEQHGESLAAAQHVLPGVVRGRPLSVRLRANEWVLRRAHTAIAAAIHDQRASQLSLRTHGA
jgi:cyclic beta-1,2-glucan synthetase